MAGEVSRRREVKGQELSIGLPTVLVGKLESLKFPPGVPQLIIPFECELSVLAVEDRRCAEAIE